MWANVFAFSEGLALCIEDSQGLVFLVENYPSWEWFHEDNKGRFKMLQPWSSLNSGEIIVLFYSVEKKHASPSLGHSPSSWRLTHQVLLYLLYLIKKVRCIVNWNTVTCLYLEPTSTIWQFKNWFHLDNIKIKITLKWFFKIEHVPPNGRDFDFLVCSSKVIMLLVTGDWENSFGGCITGDKRLVW